MSRTTDNSLKRAEAIALNPQGKGFKNEFGDAATQVYSVRIKQKSSFNLRLTGNASAELVQDRNRNARIDSGETLGRSQLSQGKNSLKLNSVNKGTYFLKVNGGGDRPATYQLTLSTQPVSLSSTSQSGGYQYLKSSSSQSRGLLSDLFGNLFGGSSSRWNGSFINRTAGNVDDYNSYNFSRPDLKKDLGGRGKSGKTLARLKLNYGSGSPGSGINSDNYALQTSTQVSLKAGKFYEVKSDSNDGTRFFFRNRQTGKVVTSLNGDWRGNSSGAWTQLLSVPENAGGSFDFYVQYYERTGDSAIDVSLKEVQPTAKVVTSTLNLRSKASTVNNSPIAALNSGTNLKILGKVKSSDDTSVPDWYQVSTSDGKRGYVAAQSNLVQVDGNSSIANFGNGSSNGGSSGSSGSNNNNTNNNSGGIQSGGTTSNPTPRPTGGSGSSDGSINSKGLNVLKSFEGLRLDSYLDPVGVWTIGYGTTSGIRAGMRITEAQAESYLKQDLDRFERAVKSAVKVSLNSDQFSALVSFTYNVGEGALNSSTLLRKLNQGDYQGAANEFARWNKGDGVELPGLTRRRSAEKALFLGQDYTAFL
ncbi:MAG: glycoside hydrolase family protein [Drouetiella hepatica Uher 2000/2452]|jgi:GH24 family phage-related lysozyme (muramidase)|uniref:Lysozyme n=1 Tax=Drouetiella hepatica Uher 2000/2452 TaxID=904376 RepID=A0A951Q7A0_9CYAN|nr:glycoside hydrolase family protein [Drouetiella hepatica Uher 2000/2452]